MFRQPPCKTTAILPSMHGRTQISRRNFVRLGLGATSCGAVSAATATAAPTGQRRAKQVLVLFEQGGVSQIDSWDPKPQAVVEHKSPFEPVATSVPGLQFTRLLARTAPLAHKLTIVRCMTQPTPGIGNSHPKGSQYIYSGEAPDGPVEMPDISSVVAMLKGSHARHLPSNIMVPGTNEQTTLTRIGFLPPAHKVFKTGGNPADRTGRCRTWACWGSTTPVFEHGHDCSIASMSACSGPTRRVTPRR
ncbi:MAG: hypothetical protein CMJ45_09715 [Planctomyces sp.]|nr:hypothetical protein [Planctomyces sp.]